ncbi:WhiB family transcriptional regulator [Actinomadura sp. KC216]|uniref:WhiB family transcriptional regulator n=1 Tax=Actinomadura sp. KC216 TaxID=2530370 RepID=UPI00104F1A52|nr:WhiB family transcriptional regulator [Actinomadura sp. KC216]TDB79714.1 WhiB family transcriptional regulator [Actinomadura sp. KC216]
MPILRHRQSRGQSPWDGPGQVDLRLEVPAWTKNALCAELGVEVFFSESGTRDHITELAKQACTACSVRIECLEWALTFEPWQDRYGVFGGAGPRERAALRRERDRRRKVA